MPTTGRRLPAGKVRRAATRFRIIWKERLRDRSRAQIRVHGAGRTDAGVHALAQCAHVDLPPASYAAWQWVAALNGVLPPAIRVLRCRYVSAEFPRAFLRAGERSIVIASGTPRSCRRSSMRPRLACPDAARLRRISSERRRHSCGDTRFRRVRREPRATGAEHRSGPLRRVRVRRDGSCHHDRSSTATVSSTRWCD